MSCFNLTNEMFRRKLIHELSGNKFSKSRGTINVVKTQGTLA